MIGHPQDLGLIGQAEAIASGAVDPAELLEATFARLEARDRALNAVPVRFADQARAMLAQAPQGNLYGVPLAICDMFSLPWRGYHLGTRRELSPPSTSGVFARLRDAGAVIVGVANQQQLSMGTTGLHSAHGPLTNPWRQRHCGGGAVGGGAAAVSARLLAGAVASDAGGSARLPAGWCGAVCVKATWGRTPRGGWSARDGTVSAAAVLGRDAADARLLSEIVFGRSLPRGGARHLTVGLIRSPYWDDVDEGVAERCADALGASGWRVIDVELPGVEHASAAGLVRAGSETAATFDAGLIADQEPMLRATAKYVAAWPASVLMRADRIRAQVRRGLSDLFIDCDVLAWPTNPAPAPSMDDPRVVLPSGTQTPDFGNVRQASLANLTGTPGISVPVGLHESGLPVGLHLLGPWGEDALLISAAEHLERVSDRAWVDAIPAIAADPAL